jgi:beta-carotene/zeaxanthin 4-ketolase
MTNSRTLPAPSLRGVWIGLTVILLWTGLLAFNLSHEVAWTNPLTYLLVLLQTHLFTGLFITAHDAMHGTVAPKRPRLNHLIGRICTFLFVFNSYQTLKPKHYLHHRHVGTEGDPDFHRGNPHFLVWYFHFLKEYISWKQLLIISIVFNLAALVLPQANLILFWVVPSILSTFQLFYFGTYLPHRGEHDHDNPHHSHSQGKNHLWAFLTCYFFGYHYEHHDRPATPWWQLWRVKEARMGKE